MKVKLKIISIYICTLAVFWLFIDIVFTDFMHFAGVRARLKSEYNQTIPKEVDYLILGDSVALYSINPTRLSSHSYSAAQLGESIYSTLNTFKKLNFKKISKAIIMGQTFNSDHYGVDIWKIFVPQKMLTRLEVLNLICAQEKNECTWYSKILLSAKFIWYRSHLNREMGENISYALKNAFVIKFLPFVEFMKFSIKRNHGHFAAKIDNPLSRTDFYRPYREHFYKDIHPPESEMTALREFICIATKFQVPIVFLEPYFFTNEKFIDLSSYRESYRQQFRTIAHPNFVFLKVDEFELNLGRDHFRDFTHLNANGANLYTDQLMKKISKVKFLNNVNNTEYCLGSTE